MPCLSRSLLEQTAEDLMSRDVVCIPSSASLRAAARRLIEAGVSGAPVVDEDGRCLGVLSHTDLARFLAKGEVCFLSDSEVFAEWQMDDVEALPGEEVSRYVTRGAITAAAQTPVGELASLMSDARVHRVLITDGRGRIIGIVSSLDVLRALAAEAAQPAWPVD
jgi:CBS-domain-containing membrane protein